MFDVRVVRPPDHCDDRERKGHRNEVARQRVDRNTGDL
jgi:hypothetical protein